MKSAEEKRIKKIRKNLMSAPNSKDIRSEDCILLGKAFGKELGINHHKFWGNTNQLVIGNVGTGKTYNYLTANLLHGTSSAIVTTYAYTGEFEKRAEQFQRKGIKAHFMDFQGGAHSARYNPFLHAEAYGEEKEIAAYRLSSLIQKTFTKPPKEGDPFLHNLDRIILEVIVLYIIAGDMPDEKRTFKTLLETIQGLDSIQDLKKYDCSSEKGFTKRLEVIGDDSVAAKCFKGCVISLAVGLQIFADPSFSECFEEKADTDNINLAEFTKEQHYLFLTGISEVCEYTRAAVSLLIPLFAHELVFLKKKTDAQTRHIQFYLDEFKFFDIPDFSLLIATSRKFGYGFSVMIQSVSQLMEKYKEEPAGEWRMIPCNCLVCVYLGYPAFGESDREFFDTLCKGKGESVIKALADKECESGNELTVFIHNHEPIFSEPIFCDRLDPKDYEGVTGDA